MRQYLDLIDNVLSHGVRQGNRTNMDSFFVPNGTINCDLRYGFPAITTKKLYFRQSIGEIIGFLRGCDSAADFRELGCKFWNSDANENATWLSSPWRKGTDDLGVIYGATWRHRDVILRAESQNQIDALENEGYEIDGESTGQNNGVTRQVMYYKKTFDQLHHCVDKIISYPKDRRIIMHAWFPELFSRMALPPCHVLYEFVPDINNKVLHMTCVQRSCDLLLGVPMNIFGGALILALVAKACGYTAGQFSHQMSNVHLYENQIEAARVQLQREPLPLPSLSIRNTPEQISTSSSIKFLETISPVHIVVDGYQHHPPLDRVEMAQEKVLNTLNTAVGSTVELCHAA